MAGSPFDGRESLTAGKGHGGAPEVQVFDAATLGIVSDFFARDTSFRGGVNLGGSVPRFP